MPHVILTRGGARSVQSLTQTQADRVLPKLQDDGWTLESSEPTTDERLAANDAKHNALVDELAGQGVLGQERAEQVRRGNPAQQE